MPPTQQTRERTECGERRQAAKLPQRWLGLLLFALGLAAIGIIVATTW